VRFLLRPIRLAADLVLPPRCAGCGAMVAADGVFCAACWSAMRFLGPPWCAACNRPLPFDPGPGARCAPCLARPPRHSGVRAAVAYGPTASTLALRLKYGRRVGLARTMARHIARLVPPEVELLVLVPLHRGRLWSRGFNQAALIAAAVGKAAGRPHDAELLVRTRAAPPLRDASPAARRRAVQGAFAVPTPARERVAGRHLGLVDDVYTTGATTDAATRALLAAGASAVTILCWARVLDGDD
jgi:ComF family protein